MAANQTKQEAAPVLPEASAPASTLGTQVLVQSQEDSILDKLNRASLNVKAGDPLPDVDITLPDACLRRKGGTRHRISTQVNGVGWKDIPVVLSNGDRIGYILDDEEAYHYGVFPLDHRYVQQGIYFPVTRDNHPDLKPHETDMRGVIKVDGRSFLCWTHRSKAKMLRARDDAPYEQRVMNADDSGTESNANSVFRKSKARRRIAGEEDELDKDDLRPSKVLEPPPMRNRD